jgi:hypothetical protein
VEQVVHLLVEVEEQVKLEKVVDMIVKQQEAGQ